MRKSIKRMPVILLALLLLIGIIPGNVMAAADPTVSYCTHVQNVGWQNYVNGGTMSGTEGKSYRLEGIKIKLDSQGYDLGISYQTHIQNIGWEADTTRGWKADDGMSGTEGLSYRLEAIQIKLTGADADKFDIYYQVHAQNIGWMGWAKNGESAGTAGYGYRLEGIRIQILPKGTAAPGSTENAFNQYVEPAYKQAYQELVNQAYQEFVVKYATGSYAWTAKYACPCSLFDMDSNGIPELFIKTGSCEADYKYQIYTYENGQAKYMGSTSGGHATLMGKTNSTGGELILLVAHMGYQQVYEIKYENGSITRNLITKGEVPKSEDYYDTGYSVPWTYARDIIS
ncbi:hypothetical protein [Acetobacterium wieringae]|uniref:hypothetical protein n=1 Tax=Acetobacterium wieringae TaxID=52694 RepID=UPI002B202B28|nr:hypothetical protein [Acetobacterium wieringae]MEA4805065.1 hypothetical protein [Acetobacterium wieringae]